METTNRAGCITSESEANMWAGGRLISAGARAYGSTRVMGTAFGTGHGCGAAAAMFARTGSVDVIELQLQLRKRGALV